MVMRQVTFEIAKRSFSRFVRSIASPGVGIRSHAAVLIPLAPFAKRLQWKQLAQLHRLMKTAKWSKRKREMWAAFLVKTPYVFAAVGDRHQMSSLAWGASRGGPGPIEHYAQSANRTDRTSGSLYPSRYQKRRKSIGETAAWLRKLQIVRLRAACVLVPKNLIKCHTYYRGLGRFGGRPEDCHSGPAVPESPTVPIGWFFSGRVSGPSVLWRGKGIDREYLLLKINASFTALIIRH